MAVTPPIDVEKLAEEYEAEKPGRRLDPIHEKIVQVACAGLSCYAIYWVLNPVPAQRYRTSFLLVALALTFLVYRGWGKRDEDDDKPERPGITDWLLALASVVALGYTLVTFDEFVRRAAQPNDLDILFGVTTILLVLEATRRTVGWILPAVVIAFLLYAFFGGELPTTWQIAHAGYGVPRIVGQTLHGPAGDLRRRRSTSPRPTSCSSRSTAPCSSTRAPGASSSTSRWRRPGARAPARGAPPRWPASCSARSRARAWRRRSRSAPSRGRSCAAPATRKEAGRRRARRVGHRRDPVAADARRRRVHHRRVPRRLLPDGADLRDDPVAPLLPRDPAGDRDRRAPLRRQGGRRRDPAGRAAAAALRLPLLVAVRDRRSSSRSGSRRSGRCCTRPCSRSCCRSSTPSTA